MGLFKKKQPDVDVTVHSEVVQATDMAGLSDEIKHTLAEHGIEAGSGTVIDASQVPGLTEEIFGALDKAGVWQQVASSEFTTVGGAPAPEDHVAQLEKLAELHKHGHLSDYEYATAKEKLLGQNWDDSARS